MSLGQTFERWLSLEGQTALVTGGGSGLAEHVAAGLAEAGATVLVGDRSLAEAERVAKDIDEAGGIAVPLAMEVADETSVLAAFDEIKAAGDLDIVFLGAMFQSGVPLVEMTVAQWDQMHETNLRGAFLCAREAVKMMVASGKGGRVLALSTIGSMHPVLSGNQAYGPSKAGLNALIRNIAHDYSRAGVRANAIAPGAISGSAPRIDGWVQGDGPGRDPNRLPFGQGPAHEVARMAVYLAGPSATYINGQTIVIDGGWMVL